MNEIGALNSRQTLIAWERSLLLADSGVMDKASLLISPPLIFRSLPIFCSIERSLAPELGREVNIFTEMSCKRRSQKSAQSCKASVSTRDIRLPKVAKNQTSRDISKAPNPIHDIYLLEFAKRTRDSRLRANHPFQLATYTSQSSQNKIRHLGELQSVSFNPRNILSKSREI